MVASNLVATVLLITGPSAAAASMFPLTYDKPLENGTDCGLVSTTVTRAKYENLTLKITSVGFEDDAVLTIQPCNSSDGRVTKKAEDPLPWEVAIKGNCAKFSLRAVPTICSKSAFTMDISDGSATSGVPRPTVASGSVLVILAAATVV